MKIVYEGGEGRIEEKKSRFIATVQPVSSEKEALDFIAAMKKKYWDASHNCSAFVVGEHQELQRCSDDGEPQGTAGRPMLEVLLGKDLHNTAAVVTRYFGGTLLGTGGLVRAYSAAVQEGLNACTIAEQSYGVCLTIRTDYNSIGKIQYLLGRQNLPTLNAEYTDIVEIRTLVEKSQEQSLRDAVIEATSGKAAFPAAELVSYVLTEDGTIIL